jgi:cytochrome c-type biogenesis protein CcmH
MAGFWIAVCLMIAAALAFVLPPLLGRHRRAHATHEAANLAIYQEKRAELAADRTAGLLDDAAFAAACAELDRELLRDVSAPPPPPGAGAAASPYPAIVIAVLVPLAATGIYLAVGAPALLLEDRAVPANAGAGLPQSVQAMVARLEQRLREQPQDTQGWVMLGRSYAAMNRLDEARAALEQANRQAPDDPMTLVTLAEVRAGQQGERLDGAPIALVRRALELAPDYPRALWLAGVHAFNAGRPDEAGTLWQRLLDTAELSPEAAAQVREAVARTGSEAAPAPAAPAAPSAAAPTGDAQVTVQVRLAPELAARVDGSETLFVFARAAQGPRMPLAIVRRTARELPLAVILDDSMAMTPQLTLSSFDQVVVSARVSRSGDAMPASGDLLGSSAPLAPAPGSAVDVVIDTVVQ